MATGRLISAGDVGADAHDHECSPPQMTMGSPWTVKLIEESDPSAPGNTVARTKVEAIGPGAVWECQCGEAWELRTSGRWAPNRDLGQLNP